MNDFLNEKFSTRAKNSLITAQELAEELGHPQAGTDHLFYGIINQGSSFASEILLKNKISANSVRLELIRLREQEKSGKKNAKKFSESLSDCLEKAAAIAVKYQYQFVGTEHLLYGLVAQEKNRAQKLLEAFEVDKTHVEKNLLAIFENVSKFPGAVPGDDLLDELGLDDFPNSSPAVSPLESFTVDLTERAAKGQIDPLIGREQELERIISILSRRNKNNPLLIGEPGVGKTAIAEGLALAISEGKVPENLLDKQVLSLDLALMVAGTMFRGEFESRLKQTIEEIVESKNVILFVDELHTVIGAGSASGSLDAANILKPALARGEIRAIGATTLTEYKKHIEQDPALERRFQTVHINEPNQSETISILQGLKKSYERHHRVKFTDEAIDQAVSLSDRYIQGRFQPDKAIDLLDETAALHKVRAKQGRKPFSYKKLQVELEKIKQKKQQAVLRQNFSLATRLKNRQIILEKTHSRLKKQSSQQKKYPLVTIEASHIAETVTRTTGIPAGRLNRGDADQALSLKKRLEKKIIGQNHALSAVISSIKRSLAGISSPDRPTGSFMFLGPSGVGKTLTAKELSQELFMRGSLIRIDMSELHERHSLSRLLGAPAGYIGFGEGGKLTESIRRNPYSVVLFDEIEKAHPEALNILLQILDEGELTDAMGKKASFRNAIIIMTSNIGLEELNAWAEGYGFTDKKNKNIYSGAEIKESVLKKIRDHFRPEFLNRIDQMVVFNPLDKKALRKIARLELKKISQILSDQEIKLEYPPQVLTYISKISVSPREGARKIRKNIQELVEIPLAEKILKLKQAKIKQIQIEPKKKNNQIVGLSIKN